MTQSGERIWTTHPEAARFVQSLLERALNACADAEVFQSTLLDACAIRLSDIIDHIAVPPDVTGYEQAGWKQIELGVWRHFGSSLPDILQRNRLGVAFKVESAERIVRALDIDAPIEGAQYGPYRRVRVFSAAGAYFDAVERLGWAGFEAPVIGARRIERARLHQQIFRTRPRPYRRAGVALSMTKRLATAAIADLGKHWACALFMRAEREYWAEQCKAGFLQGRRQDKLGVGWCNIDHYAYRCSREHFGATVTLLERLGFERREVLYSGAKVGYGAHVMEQPALRSAVLVEVDMTPEDLVSANALSSGSPLLSYNEAGVWTALNGESMLEGGLSHAAGRYQSRALRDYLQGEGVVMSARPGDGARLHQMRTVDTRRAVDPKRVDGLERSGQLGVSEANDFRFNGAESAQFEGVERSDGFKGFGQVVAAAGQSKRHDRRSSALLADASLDRSMRRQFAGRSRVSRAG